MISLIVGEIVNGENTHINPPPLYYTFMVGHMIIHL